MTMQIIRHRYTGEVIFEGRHRTLAHAVRTAVVAGINLAYADLSRANLNRADLTDAILYGANLTGTTLIRAILDGANLTRVNLTDANLTRANLTDANLVGANLDGADLTGATLTRADLTCVILTGAILPPAPAVPHIDAAILAAIGTDAAGLDMRTWHGECCTTHCRAGWAVTLAGEEGRALERSVGISAAAALIYAASSPGGCVVPNWYASGGAALADMRKRAAKAKEMQP
jgi:uncharacterized protein YjbI with pentapeptide repeats